MLMGVGLREIVACTTARHLGNLARQLLLASVLLCPFIYGVLPSIEVVEVHGGETRRDWRVE